MFDFKLAKRAKITQKIFFSINCDSSKNYLFNVGPAIIAERAKTVKKSNRGNEFEKNYF